MKTTRILVIPGIGDLHWVALKLASFCEVHGIKHPEVWVWNFDDRPRSLEFVQRLPFVKAGGYWNQPLTNEWRTAFNSCYMLGTKDVISPFGEFDYFICINGALRQGRKIADILPECQIEWDYPLRRTSEELMFGSEQNWQGQYLLLYFSDQGMFLQWLKAWPIAKVANFIDTLHKLLPEYRLLLTGSAWDQNFTDELIKKVTAPTEYLVGHTNFDQFMGLIRYASGFVGWCGGNTIVSTHIGTPTYMLWSDYFCKGMQTNWVDPNKIGRIYSYDNVANISEIEAAKRFSLQIRSAA